MPMINQRAGRVFKWVEKEKEKKTQTKAKRESEEKPVALFQENDRVGAKANAICAKGDERTETKEKGNTTLHPEPRIRSELNQLMSQLDKLIGARELVHQA
ncbi:hypothetical protein PIB30_023840 [Stylosanthes scabra]|uniref:Uncharacterized protein n=1 Tax=Stylosanthes scabra TaxID=79078 RepID=A0ABU6QA58_9FABA|nr:hypothetical protein [Stylosanthes scabra]